MKLKELTGIHVFSGIEVGTMDIPSVFGEPEKCNYVKFTIDGVHYVAIEDPEDGYRSVCRELQVSNTAPKTTFMPQPVECSMMANNSYEINDVLVVSDRFTGKVVLEIGTRNWGDYYPYFHLRYIPENMACNATRKPMTNADRIRAMTDEELENGIRKISIGWEPWCDHHCKMNGDDDCNDCLKKYIKQPVKGDAE